MPNNAKSRNRLHDLYEEGLDDAAQDYGQLRRRMIELSLASARAMQAIDKLLERLQGSEAQRTAGQFAHS